MLLYSVFDYTERVYRSFRKPLIMDPLKEYLYHEPTREEFLEEVLEVTPAEYARLPIEPFTLEEWREISGYTKMFGAVYSILKSSMGKKGLELLGDRFIRNYAHNLTLRLLAEKAKKKAIKRAALAAGRNFWRAVGAWMEGLSTATLGIAALVTVALAAVAILVINPSKQGIRITGYKGRKWVLRYHEYLWWADHIGTSAMGKRVFLKCGDIPAVIVGERKLEVRDYDEARFVDLEPIEVVKEAGWWYWLSVPEAIELEFIGFAVNHGGDHYYLQDAYEPKRPADPRRIWTKGVGSWCEEPEGRTVTYRWGR